MAAPDFWSNRERAQSDVEEVSRLRSLISPFQELEREIEDFNALQQLATEETDGTARAQAEKEVATEHTRLIHELEEFELRQFLSGENDRANAFLTIHSGAGCKSEGRQLGAAIRTTHLNCLARGMVAWMKTMGVNSGKRSKSNRH